ncbi:MAG TPA: Eco57I restriction-modification methylase domain-containing protein, partial [Acidobacteriota bacterium]|nr:Eco57I restriction-modification methylase domain-containing protein [Acidobacteriota bacterium]
ALDPELAGKVFENLLAAYNPETSTTARRLASWNPYDQNASADFFDAEWMFGISDGFDVAIGNPPYVSALDFARIYGDALREQLNARYESATGAYDFFVLFVEQGLKLCKQFGHLCFITPNKYLAAKYAVGLRGWILKQASLKQLLDVSPIPVFEEAAVYPVVSIFCKDGGQAATISVSLPTTRNLERFAIEHYEQSNVPADWLRMLPENIWGFLLSKHAKLLPKLMKCVDPLSKLGEVNATSTAAEADEYGRFLTAARGTDGLKIINTGTIDPYISLWGATEMTHAGKKLLTPYLPVAQAKVNARRLAMYKSPKIIFAKMAKSCEAVIDASGEFASLNTNCFYSPRPNVSLKYVGGVCNTRMFMFLYDLFFGALRMSGGYYQFQAPQLRVIPFARADAKQQRRIEETVDRILATKKKNSDADTTALEREIDQQVYALYGLTPEEIAIVEKTPT